MKTIQLCLLLLIITLAQACNKNSQQAKKTTSTSDFSQLYQAAVTTGYSDKLSLDLEVHAYTFQVSAQHSIYQIGYQSNPAISTTPYLIEISDSTTSTLLYSGANVFSPTATSYITITPVTVVPGHYYTVKRIQTNWGNYISNTVGRIASATTNNSTSPLFPRTYGDLTIIGSSFYGTGGPINNEALPYIDLVW